MGEEMKFVSYYSHFPLDSGWTHIKLPMTENTLPALQNDFCFTQEPSSLQWALPNYETPSSMLVLAIFYNCVYQLSFYLDCTTSWLALLVNYHPPLWLLQNARKLAKKNYKTVPCDVSIVYWIQLVHNSMFCDDYITHF